MSFTLSLVYILWSCKKIKKLPKNENRIKPKLKNGYEGEYSMCMKIKWLVKQHEMIMKNVRQQKITKYEGINACKLTWFMKKETKN